MMGTVQAMRHICIKFGILELVNLVCLRDARVNGMVNVDEEVCKKCICESLQEVGREGWKNGLSNPMVKKICEDKGMS